MLAKCQLFQLTFTFMSWKFFFCIIVTVNSWNSSVVSTENRQPSICSTKKWEYGLPSGLIRSHRTMATINCEGWERHIVTPIETFKFQVISIVESITKPTPNHILWWLLRWGQMGQMDQMDHEPLYTTEM